MESGEERWVPKVHPATRALASEDPLELMAEPVSGDPAVMLECLLQEFMWLGWDAEQLLRLFHSPAYPLLCQLREHFGEEAVQRQVADLVDRWGVLRFRETIVEPDDNEEEDGMPDLVQLTLPPRDAP